MLFLIALLLLLVGWSIKYSLKVATPRKDGMTQSAILRWAQQIRAMESGENIHAKYNYPNPPIMPQMLWPWQFATYIAPASALLLGAWHPHDRGVTRRGGVVQCRRSCATLGGSESAAGSHW